MGNIKELTPAVIRQIAAGQVVDRPATVVKELVENSLDAQATHITIELESAGKRKIIVTDNGLGMSLDDLTCCFLHHTTSKITTTDDLFHITTLGFRGEALSSITGVADLRIESKPSSELAGKYIELRSAAVIKTGPVGMPTGTRIVVSGLFSQTPARKKFLKSETTEFTHILQTLTNLALGNLQVAFTLIHNKKTVFELPEKQELVERCAQLLSQDIVSNFLPIQVQADHFSVTGYLGKPQIGTQSKQRQFLFVNNRAVHSPEISQLAKRVFATLLEPRSYPAFVLYIQLSPELVDVNVDPQKTKVRFIIQSEITQHLETAITQVLDSANLTYSNSGSSGFYEEYSMDSGIARAVKTFGSGWSVTDTQLIADTQVLQVHNLYLVAQTKRGILIVDQHAAHERILYQEFLEKFARKNTQTIQLQKPITLTLPVAESQFLRDHLDIFDNIGFSVTQDTTQATQNSLQNSFVITQIPKIFQTRNIQRLLQELLHDSIAYGKPKDLDVGTQRTLAYLACRTAIKAGDLLTPQESKRLIEKLLQTKGQYTCPHGRPVQVEVDLQYLDKLFKRTK